MFNPNVVYNDKLICLQGGIALRKSKPKVFSFNLFPNPATDQVTVQYSIETDGVLKIINTIGETVSIHRIPSDNNQIKVDTKNLTNGIYFVSLRDNNQANKIIKFVISK